MKLFHRPAHTVSPILHREARAREGRLRFVLIGALLGALLTSGATFAIARVNNDIARVHARHRLERARPHFANARVAAKPYTTMPLALDAAACGWRR